MTTACSEAHQREEMQQIPIPTNEKRVRSAEVEQSQIQSQLLRQASLASAIDQNQNWHGL